MPTDDLDPFSSFLDDIDMGAVNGASCKIVHPLLDELLDNLPFDRPEWRELPTGVQMQLRVCLAKEIVMMTAPTLERFEDVFSEDDGARVVLSPGELLELVDLTITLALKADAYVKERIG